MNNVEITVCVEKIAKGFRRELNVLNEFISAAGLFASAYLSVNGYSSDRFTSITLGDSQQTD